MNNVKTVGLLALMSALLAGLVGWLGGFDNVGVMLAVVIGFNFLAYFFSSKMALAATRARPVTEAELPQVYAMVRRLAAQMNIPEPSIYIIDSPQPNAFATGRSPKHAAVAVTEGIMRLLSADELRGVLAHELSHVRNRDTLISAIAATLAGVVLMVARMAQFAALFGGMRRDERDDGGGPLALLAMVIVAPLAATLIQLAISRAREYEADATGARLSHAPHALAAALEKIAIASGRVPLPAGPATAHLWIEEPAAQTPQEGRMSRFNRLFAIHPPIEERIALLREM